MKSEAYTAWRNGWVERLNWTLKHHAKAMLVHAGLLLKFWARAIMTAAYVINCLPSHTNDDGLPCVTPYKLMHGSAPGIDHMCAFGSICYPTIPKPLQTGGTIIPSLPHIFVGYDEFASEGYVVFDPAMKRFYSRRTVTFDERWRTRQLDSGRMTSYADSPLLTDYKQLLLPSDQLPPPTSSPTVTANVHTTPLEHIDTPTPTHAA